MKFLVPLTLLAATGVSAQDVHCDAEYIVTECLGIENMRATACPAADWDCLCAAYEAIATCYNNCPNDPRAFSAKGQVSNFCANASVYGTKAKAAATAAAAATGSLSAGSVAAQTTGEDNTAASSAASAAASTTASPTESAAASKASGSASAKASSTGAADSLSGGSGSMFVAVAGVVAALL